MSLKNIGQLGGYASLFDGINSYKELIQLGSATSEQKDAFKSLRDSLKGLSVDEATKKLGDLKLNPELTKELLEAARNGDLLTGTADEIADKMKKVGKSSSFVDDLGLAFSGLTNSIKSAGSSLLSFIVANPWIAAATGIGAAMIGAILISDRFIETYDEASEKAKESANAYSTTKSELESLSSELKTTQERLQELQKLQDSGAIAPTEEEELKRLQITNEELEREYNIKKKLAELQKTQANDDAENALNKNDASTASMYDDKGNKYVEGSKMYDSQVESMTDADALEADMKKVEDFNKKIIELKEKQASDDITQKEFDKLQKEIDKYESAIDDMESDMRTRAQNISNNLQNVSNKDSELYKKNTLIVEKYLNIDNSTTADSLNGINSALQETNKGFSKSEMVSQLNNMSEGFEELGKIYESIADSDPFDFKLLDNDNFKETFSGLGEVYTDFVEQVASTPNDINACQSAFDNLVTEWIKNLNILEGVTEENANLTISMLEQMGVANAQQIIDQMFSIVNEESQILNDAEAEFLATYQNYLVSKDEADLNYLESSASKNGQLISALGEGYQQDYKNWCDLLSKKAEAYNELVKAVGGSYNSAVSTVDNLMANGVTPTMSSITAAEAAKGQYQMLTEAANKAKNSLKLDLSQIKTSFGSSYKPSGALGGGGSSSNKDSGGSGGSSKETIEDFNWIERAIQKVQRTITNLGKTVSATYKTWATRNDALKRQISSITDEISVQQKAYDYYMKKASSLGLSSSYISKIQNGTINIETIKDEKLIEKIKKYQELYDQANDAQDAISDLRDELANLAKQRFDNVAQEFENQISGIEHEINMLESYIDQTEAKGYLVSTKYYSSLAKTQRENIALLEPEYASLNSALTEAMSTGKIEKYSDDWYDMMSQIQGVKEELVEANTALIEYNNSLRELEWERFDKGQEMISDLIAESEFLRDLMSDEKLFDEKGNVTEFGNATFGLHAVDYNTYMSQADDYAKELLELNKQIAEDPSNQLLLDRRRELIETQREMIISANEEREAMKSLAEEGYNTMLDYMNELIDKRKSALDEMKSLSDYEKTISDQAQTVSELRKIQMALQNDSSESGQLALQQNAVKLKEAEETLRQSELDRQIEEEQKMLDNFANDVENWVSQRLDNLDGLVSDVIDSTNENSDSIRETLESVTNDVGISLTDEMQAIWSGSDGIKSVVSMYGDNFNTNVTTVNNTLLGIKSLLESMVKEADKDASDNITEARKPSTSTPSTPTPTPTPSTPSTTTKPSSTSSSSTGTIKVGGKINAGNAKIYDYAGDTSGERQLFRNDPYYIVLDERNNYLKVRHHSLKSGVTGWFKKSDVKAYKTGGLVDYTGLAWVDGQKKKPEAFLNAQDTENISELKDTLTEVDASQLKLLTMEQIREFTSSIDELKPIVESMIKRPDFTPMTNSQNFEVNFDITMHGVNDPQTFAQQIKEVYSNNTRNLRSMLQTDMFSKNSFEHRKYM